MNGTAQAAEGALGRIGWLVEAAGEHYSADGRAVRGRHATEHGCAWGYYGV